MYTHWHQTTVNERTYGAERIHSLVWLAKTRLDQLHERYSTAHFEQRGAARSPTTLTLSMLLRKSTLTILIIAPKCYPYYLSMMRIILILNYKLGTVEKCPN